MTTSPDVNPQRQLIKTALQKFDRGFNHPTQKDIPQATNGLISLVELNTHDSQPVRNIFNSISSRLLDRSTGQLSPVGEQLKAQIEIQFDEAAKTGSLTRGKAILATYEKLGIRDWELYDRMVNRLASDQFSAPNTLSPQQQADSDQRHAQIGAIPAVDAARMVASTNQTPRVDTRAQTRVEATPNDLSTTSYEEIKEQASRLTKEQIDSLPGVIVLALVKDGLLTVNQVRQKEIDPFFTELVDQVLENHDGNNAERALDFPNELQRRIGVGEIDSSQLPLPILALYIKANEIIGRYGKNIPLERVSLTDITENMLTFYIKAKGIFGLKPSRSREEQAAQARNQVQYLGDLARQTDFTFRWKVGTIKNIMAARDRMVELGVNEITSKERQLVSAAGFSLLPESLADPVYALEEQLKSGEGLLDWSEAFANLEEIASQSRTLPRLTPEARADVNYMFSLLHKRMENPQERDALMRFYDSQLTQRINSHDLVGVYLAYQTASQLFGATERDILAVPLRIRDQGQLSSEVISSATEALNTSDLDTAEKLVGLCRLLNRSDHPDRDFFNKIDNLGQRVRNEQINQIDTLAQQVAQARGISTEDALELIRTNKL